MKVLWDVRFKLYIVMVLGERKCIYHKIVQKIAELDNHCYGNRQSLLH